MHAQFGGELFLGEPKALTNIPQLGWLHIAFDAHSDKRLSQ
jgi:hypothetical protein